MDFWFFIPVHEYLNARESMYMCVTINFNALLSYYSIVYKNR